MKHLYLFFLLFITTASFSQESTLIKKEDFKFEDGARWRVTSKPINIKNGENKLLEVLVTVAFSENLYSKIDIDKINEMIQLVNQKSRNSTKNEYTYISRVIKISSMPGTEVWHATIEFTAQNDFGATKTGMNSADFDENYNLVKFSNLL